jgi:hypothetical protein
MRINPPLAQPGSHNPDADGSHEKARRATFELCKGHVGEDPGHFEFLPWPVEEVTFTCWGKQMSRWRWKETFVFRKKPSPGEMLIWSNARRVKPT